MSRPQRDFEIQFASLIGILDQLSHKNIDLDSVTLDEQLVGSGGYGEVQKATIRGFEPQNIVAVKILRTHGSKSQRARVAVQLAREIHIMSQLSHPNIIPLVGYCLDKTNLTKAYITMPYMSMGNVGEYLDDNDVDIQKRLEMALEVGRGLLYLHTRSPPICHADIKPENILVTDHDDVHVVLSDFGISRVMSESSSHRLTTTSSVKGSAVYMSPDLFSDNPQNTLKSDVWAWGCVVLRIASGIGPYSKLTSQNAIIGSITQGLKPAPPDLFQRPDMEKCVSELSYVVDLGLNRSTKPALAVLHGLSMYRINPDRLEIFDSFGFARGGSAIVARGRLSQNPQGLEPRYVAIKKTRHASVMAFAEEIGLLSQLSHPNIIKFIGFSEELGEGIAWCTVSYAEHGNVRGFLASGAWSLPHRISLMWDIASGVKYLHSFRPPIVHGDLKSLNVVVNEEGHAEIIDFGSARMLEVPSDYERTWTVRWASPELLLDERATTSTQSDIWALGWTFWEVLTGQIPLEEAKTEAQFLSRILQQGIGGWTGIEEIQVQTLRDLILTCLQRDPEQRPTASDCFGALQFMPKTPPVPVKDH